MQVNKFRSAPPNASAMIETLRGLGYSTGAALADIIDNSISAGAKNISLKFIWNDLGSSILVIDDGRRKKVLEVAERDWEIVVRGNAEQCGVEQSILRADGQGRKDRRAGSLPGGVFR